MRAKVGWQQGHGTQNPLLPITRSVSQLKMNMNIKRQTCISSFVVLMLILLFVPTIGGCKDDDTVSFPDPNLESAIRIEIGKETGKINKEDLLVISVLAPHYVTDLSGIEYCTNLKKLHLGDEPKIHSDPPHSGVDTPTQTNYVSDLSPISNLRQLTVLEAHWNEISDISALSELTMLTKIDLGRNEISDISPLGNLPNLNIVFLGWNNISDITPLIENKGISTGDTINLRDNRISRDQISRLEEKGVNVEF